MDPTYSCLGGISLTDFRSISGGSKLQLIEQTLHKVCSINFEPPDIDQCSACHVCPISRGVWIFSILFILNRFTLGLN